MAVNIELRFNCGNCGLNISEKKLKENKFVCPKCGQKERWFSDPMNLPGYTPMFRLEDD